MLHIGNNCGVAASVVSALCVLLISGGTGSAAPTAAAAAAAPEFNFLCLLLPALALVLPALAAVLPCCRLRFLLNSCVSSSDMATSPSDWSTSMASVRHETGFQFVAGQGGAAHCTRCDVPLRYWATGELMTGSCVYYVQASNNLLA